MAAPITPQATPTRACERQRTGLSIPKPWAIDSPPVSGNFEPAFGRARHAQTELSLQYRCARNPGASFSTTNPPTRPSSSFAQTTLTSAMEALPIQHLLPSQNIMISIALWRCVSIPPGSEPCPCSVSAKQPTLACPRPSPGSQRACCSGEPNEMKSHG